MGVLTLPNKKVSQTRRSTLKELFLDVETTGTWLDGDAFSHKTKSGSYYHWDDLTEIAVCDAEGNEVYRSYVRPKHRYFQCLSKWYPSEKPIGAKNSDWTKASNGKSPVQVVKELRPILQGTRVIVHNLSFDEKVLRDSYAVSAGENHVGIHDLFPSTEFICSRKRATRVMPKAETHYRGCGERCRGHRLTHLHHQFGFGDYDEHDPLADVQALARVWSVLTTKS